MREKQIAGSTARAGLAPDTLKALCIGALLTATLLWQPLLRLGGQLLSALLAAALALPLFLCVRGGARILADSADG